MRSYWGVAQSCPPPCYSMDCSQPGSSIHGILQARILEWVTVPFSRGYPPGSYTLLTQGLNPGLPHCRQILYSLSHKGSPILRMVWLVLLWKGEIWPWPQAGGASGKEPTCQCRRHWLGFDPWVRKIPWRGAWQLTPVFLPGESHGPRSLAGYNPWGRKSQIRLSN